MAVAVVGGAFLSASLQVLFDRMASPEFVNFFRAEKQQGSRLLPRLKSTLLAIRIVLDDADNKQFTNTSIKDWLDELQDALYHADDLIDEISTNSPIITTFDEIENIIERLDYFAKYKDVLGLREVNAGHMYMSNRLATTCLVDEIGVYGLTDDKEKLIKLLLADDEESKNQISVLPIVGMSGIGKTTLAQLVYNDSRVDAHFDKMVWVCVSEQFDVLRITKTILEAVTLQKYDINDDLNQLQVELIQSLRQQKFLLVLDDVWNESYNVWDVLRMPFRAGAHGSKVIVTTRNASVASMMQTVHFHRVQELSDNDCWSLFSKHAFDSGYSSGTHPNLEVIGKEIVKKCGGLPLAAKTLGGILRSKLDVEEWEYILKSEIWDLPNDKSEILPALRLSYHYLPSRVKRCFAHCSVFSKDYEFRKEELVLIWMAENLLLPQPKSNLTMEEIGDQCFREMVSRSFLQQAYNNKSYFVMHDLIHDLAQFISGGSCISLEDDKQPLALCEKVRHFSYVRGEFDALNKFQEIANVKILRTFLPLKLPIYYVPNYKYRSLYLNSKVVYDMLPMLRCLRVLSLSHYNIVELPHSIVYLRHLRYLDVSYTKIKSLPDSITTLCNLQTLLLSNCRLLTTLPRDFKKLILLRHLDLSGTNLIEMPTEMDRLKNLGFLSTFVVGKDSGSKINILSELRHLRRALSIVRLENVINGRDASDANLKAMNKLEKLVLEWSVTTNNLQDEFDVLNKLQPHKNLKNLTIKNYTGELFPSWLGEHFFANMVSLRLESCSGCFMLPRLGQLSSLKFLMIGGMKRIKVVGPEFYGDDSFVKPFASLEILRFEDMVEWEEWHFLGVGEFSCLQELHMVNCPKLAGNLPDKVVSLRKLEIFGCHQLSGSLPNNQFTVFFDQVRLSSLQKLVISDISNLEEFPLAVSNLINLEVLIIDKCNSLESLENTKLPSALKILRIGSCNSLKFLPKGIAQINNRLQDLIISKCSSLVSFPSGGLPLGLKTLDISFCRKLELNQEIENCYTSIEHLRLWRSCSSLKQISLGLCTKIIFVRIIGCFNFEKFLIPDRVQNLIRLRFVEIKYCNNVISFLDGVLSAPDLKLIRVSNCKNLKSLPSFSSIRSLYLVDCPKLECLSEGYLPSNLRVLSISKCTKLVARRKYWGLQRIPSLREFTIDGDYEEDTLKNFPEEWLLPSSLSELVISSSPNLKTLNHRGFQDLASLKSLRIYSCPRLESLPEEMLPGSLSALCVHSCPLLIRRCQKEKGDDWFKIAHIPFIELDDVIF